MAKARMFALVSALMSLVYIACVPAVFILLFFNWRISLGLLPFGAAAAYLAKLFNGLKLREVYGKEAGAFLNEMDWASRRRLDP
jgi:hypothetical protein